MSTALRDEAIRHLRATTQDLKTARGGMRVIRDSTLAGTRLYLSMESAIAATDSAIDDVRVALDGLHARHWTAA